MPTTKTPPPKVETCNDQHGSGRICLRPKGHKGRHQDAEGVHWAAPDLIGQYGQKVQELTTLARQLGKTVAVTLKALDGTPALIPVELTPEELRLILEALDSHEYWQLSDESERRDGHVILPEDREEVGEGEDVEEDDDDNHDEIRACRALGAKLEALKRGKA